LFVKWTYGLYQNIACPGNARLVLLWQFVTMGSPIALHECGVFMSVLHTLKACGVNPAERFERALDRYAAEKQTDMFDALFGGLDL